MEVPFCRTPNVKAMNIVDFEGELKSWVVSQIIAREPEFTCKDMSWQALSGDAGFRKYFRVRLNSCELLAVFSPPETENNLAFLTIAEFLLGQCVRVPKIVAHDIDKGLFLVEDLGETLFLDHLDAESVDVMYGEALLELIQIQLSPVDHEVFPSYDREKLLVETALFPQWFVGAMLGHDVTSEERTMLEHCFDTLLVSAEEQTQVLVHRDYHSRNIVYGQNGVPGVIDFQDAVIGPFTYDVASLLRDCYIEWPRKDVEKWLFAYGNMAADAGVMPPVSQEHLLRWFDLMGLQRHIKVLGIFARLSLRDGKHGYLNDLPLVVKYVRSVSGRYEELKAFSSWFEGVLVPLIDQQAWSSCVKSI